MYLLPKFCCICLSKTAVLSSFQDEHLKLLEYCVPELVFDNTISLHICEKCNKQLTEMYTFKRTCITSHNVIAGYVTQIKNANFTGNKIDNFSVDFVYSNNNEFVNKHEENQVNLDQMLVKPVKEKLLLTDEYSSVKKIQDEASASGIQETSIKTEQIADDRQIDFEQTNISQTLVQSVKEELILSEEYLTPDEIQIEANMSVKHDINIISEIFANEEQIKLEATPSGSCNDESSPRLDDIVFVDVKDIKTEQIFKENEELEHNEFETSEGSTIIPPSLENMESNGKKQENRRKKYECHQCGKYFINTLKLNNHMIIHTGEKPYVCDICGKGYTRSATLQRHKSEHTGERRYKCKDCGKAFAHSNNLKVHRRMHTGVSPYMCDTCGKAFTTSTNLKNHHVVHSTAKTYKCGVCGKGFRWLSSLQRHKSVHTGEWQYKCDYCGKGFTSLSYLQVHTRIHTGVRLYKCNTCGKAFHLATDLNRHQVVHTGEKKFKCEMCGKSFTQLATLRTHALVHTEVNAHKCDVCGKAFFSSGNLSRHRALHTGEKKYECDICNNKFTRLSNLKIHKTRHHS